MEGGARQRSNLGNKSCEFPLPTPASDELKIEASNKYISEEGKKKERGDLEGILGGQPKPRVWKLEPDYNHEIVQCFPKRYLGNKCHSDL